MLESLWRILWSTCEAWRADNVTNDLWDLQASLKMLRDAFAINDETQIQAMVAPMIPVLESALNDSRIFLDANSENATFSLWNDYLKFVSILLYFIRAERDGNWPLHLEMFKEMLPLMAVYDHVNYTRWGTVYLFDMQQLSETAPTVYREFMDGNFVMKHTPQKFNNVSTDQALEFVNKMCKVSGGLVGITRTESSMNWWLLTCSGGMYYGWNGYSSVSSAQRRIVYKEQTRQKWHPEIDEPAGGLQSFWKKTGWSDLHIH